MSQFVTVDVIGKKRDKKELSHRGDQVCGWNGNFTSGAIADYQMKRSPYGRLVVLIFCVLMLLVF